MRYYCYLRLDIDECETNTDNCDVNAKCKNTKGSFHCTCNIGFTGNGVVCEGKFILFITDSNENDEEKLLVMCLAGLV